VPPKFKSREEIEKAILSFLEAHLQPHMLNSGELCDSLMSERSTSPFSVFIMKSFKGTNHKVLFLSKMTNVQHFLENDWQKNAVLAWSINASSVAKRFEKRMPNPKERIAAAKEVYEAGYEVRVRLDPMVPVLNWQTHYGQIIDDICSNFKPERVTLGTLRGLASTIAAAKDKEWVKYLTESSNWGRKPSLETRLAMYEFAITQFRQHGIRKIAVCKDTKQVWAVLSKKFGLNYHEMTCNCLL
jgi:spore photoproduct lyase